MVTRSRKKMKVLSAVVLVSCFVVGTAIAQEVPPAADTPTPVPPPTHALVPTPVPTATHAPPPTHVPTPTPVDIPVPHANEKPKKMASSDDGGSDCTMDMVVVSAPVCASFVGKEMQVYFIGDKSDAFPNGIADVVRIPGGTVLRTRYPSGSGNILLWSGVNPVSGAKVFISWLSDDRLIHFHTYTWDRYYKHWKPYIFVIDKANQVKLWKG